MLLNLVGRINSFVSKAGIDDVYVTFFSRSPNGNLNLLRLEVDTFGTFSATIDTPKSRTLQAKLYDTSTDTLLATSDIVTIENNSAEFILTLDPPALEGTLYSRLHTAFKGVDVPFPDDENERALWYGLVDDPKAAVRRYYNAIALAKEFSQKADGDVWNFYQDYQGALDPKSEEYELAGRMMSAGSWLAGHKLFHEIIFGLLRGQPNVPNITDLLALSSAELEHRLISAANAGEIADVDAKDVVEVLASMRSGLHMNFDAGVHPVGPLVLLADPGLKSVPDLLDYLMDGKPVGTVNAAPKALLEILSPEEHARLVAAQAFFKTTKNDPLLAGWYMAHLVSDKPKRPLFPGQGRNVDPIQLKKYLSTTSVNEWAKLIKTSGTPDQYKDDQDPVQSYAAQIAASVLGQMPNETMLAQLKGVSSKSLAPVAKILEQHPEFDVRTRAVDTYFTGENKLGDQERKVLKSFARVNRLVPMGTDAVGHTATLMEHGIGSARDVLGLGKISFTDMFIDKLPAQMIAQTYCHARTVVDMVGEVHVQMAHSGLASQAGLAHVAFGGTPDPSLTDVTPPNLADMFGSQDTCACDACQSVHSPAAYLHNLLFWMHSDVAGAYPELVSKRPDTPNILLNCENTHTILPYIDLVNEALSWTIDEADAPTQTTWSEEELRLQPEYRYVGDNSAEHKITVAQFPLALPYNRTNAEGRAALKGAGTSTADVMMTVLNRDRLSWTPVQKRAYHAARLELDPQIYDILTTNTPDANFWALQTGATTPPRRNVGEIMAALGLSFEQTDALLRLNFVAKDRNGDDVFLVDDIAFSDSECSYLQANYNPVGSHNSEFTDVVCLRALRLVRLARATGYELAMLDQLLARFSALDPGSALDIDHDFLEFLSAAHELNALLGTKFDDVLTYLELPYANGSIDRNNAFAQLFANRSGHDIEQAMIYLAAPHFDLTQIEHVTAFLVEATPLLENMTAIGTRHLPPLAAESDDRSAVLANAPNSLLAQLDLATSVPALANASLTDIETAIFDTAAQFFDVPVALCQDIYADRGDTWVKAFSDPTNVDLSDVPDYTRDVWRAGHHAWLYDILAACDVHPEVVDFAIREFDPTASATSAASENYLDLPLNLDAILWAISSLSKRFRATHNELAQLLLKGPNGVMPTWLSDAHTTISQIFQGSLTDVETVEKSLRLEEQAKVLDVSVETIASLFSNVEDLAWAVPSTDGSRQNLAADLFSRAAKIAPARKREAFEEASDTIRKDLRDALLDLTIHLAPEDGFADMEDVYRHLLLDPGMQPCMMTSRLKLATSSVQLLMHRAMMNLEARIKPDEDDQAQWLWRKNYRVWEANTKILLYPENWIDPALRINPTPLFEQSTALLAQDEVNEQTSEAVIYDYLSGLDKIARLDIRAFQKEGDTLHVFGRTWVAPYEHFYRRRENDVWTHWEKIDIDIESDHIIPVFFHRRLWLFWPIFLDKQHKNEAGEDTAYKEIRMAYSTYEYGKWRGKKMLGQSVNAGPRAHRWAAMNLDKKTQDRHYTPVSMNPKDFFFYAWVDRPLWDGRDVELVITVRRVALSSATEDFQGFSLLEHEDGWSIKGCNSDGEVVPAGHNHPSGRTSDKLMSRPLVTKPHFQNMVQLPIRGDTIEVDDDGQIFHLSSLFVKDGISRFGGIPILSKVQKNYALTYPQQRHALWENPFFMMDKDHTHFFERSSSCYVVSLENGPNGPVTAHEYQQDDTYDVTLHEHPYACKMISTFNQFGIDGLYGRKTDPDGMKRQKTEEDHYFGSGNIATYNPDPYDRINAPYPVLNFDFDHGTAYGTYNWELFFHLPTMIARQLKSDGKHADAIRWLSMVYDPTNRDPVGPRRVWRIKPFATADSRSNIASLVQLLGQTPSTPEDVKLRKSFEAQLKAWRQNPFEPHKIAEHRQSAYMMWAALEYVDTLIEWGDALFKQDSIESINEATNLYMLADAILGKRPSNVEKGSAKISLSFEDLQPDMTVDTSTDWMTDLESWMIGASPDTGCSPQGCHASVFGALSPNGYFCIPPNPKLPEYWDRVADRLFKIRHCRNLSGERRSLALFQPPIDPALLVKARASGLSIADVLANLSETGMGYRFPFLLQKAQDFTAEVKSFGGQLLSALEKRDGEELSLIRQTHERNIQKATKTLKKMSLDEAKEGLAALRHSRASAQISYDYYEGREFENDKEKKSRELTYVADGFMIAEQVSMLIAGGIALVPDTNAGTVNFVSLGGGDKLSSQAKAVALAAGIGGSLSRSGSSRASTKGSFQRRMDDWQNQAATTLERLKELDRQIAGAEIRLQTTEKDLEVFEMQIEQAADVYDYAKSKFTGEKLYGWMANTLKTAHRQAFELATNMARQAQLAANRELRSKQPLSHITADQWDSSRAGLLAGEQLSLQLKQLDNAYWKEKDRLNVYEMTRTISLRRLNPKALYDLKMWNSDPTPAEFELPEWLFQSDHNDNALEDMRIQSVAVSLPCTTGPNTKVDLRLKLTATDGQFAAKDSIITSTAQSDSGRFDTNPNGNSYLPFENAGVASKWEVSLPKRLEFDPMTINDLVLTVRYTGVPSGEAAQTVDPAPFGSFALSLRQDFYDAWFATTSLPINTPIAPTNLFGAPDPVSTPQIGPIFPLKDSTTLKERAPYVYAGIGMNLNYDKENVYLLIDPGNGPQTLIRMSTALTVQNGRIVHSDGEVIDIIAIVNAS